VSSLCLCDAIIDNDSETITRLPHLGGKEREGPTSSLVSGYSRLWGRNWN
jgi:hypothetical protein